VSGPHARAKSFEKFAKVVETVPAIAPHFVNGLGSGDNGWPMGGLRTIAIAIALSSAPAFVYAQPAHESFVRVVPNDPNAAPAPTESASRSVGVPDRGRLLDGVQLATSPYLVYREPRRHAQYGTAELVGMIERAAARVAVIPGGTPPRLFVGDLSGSRGGRIPPHRSHRSGRDADIGFFYVDEQSRPIEPPQFVSLRRDGCGQLQSVRYCFDPARSWDLIVAMLTDPQARVQYVLIAPDIRRRLIEEGERRGVAAELLARVSTATEPHSGSHSHRSHFHVRIYCPVDDRPQCVDEPPYHAWYEGAPSPQVVEVSRRRATTRRAIRARRARIRQRAIERRRARRGETET
jgi:penicillin-insensitive murein DD-endopeptidase